MFMRKPINESNEIKVIELYRRKGNHNEVMCRGTIVKEDYIVKNKLFSKIKCDRPYNPMYVIGKIYTVYAGDIHYIKLSSFSWG